MYMSDPNTPCVYEFEFDYVYDYVFEYVYVFVFEYVYVFVFEFDYSSNIKKSMRPAHERVNAPPFLKKSAIGIFPKKL